VHDRCASNGNPVAGCTPSTERVSLASDGTEGNGGGLLSISEDGRFVAFGSDASNLGPGIVVHDRLTGVTERVSVASDGTQANELIGGAPILSADGRFVAFESFASNLVSGDTNGTGDIFVHDRLTGVTERVSVASDGTQVGSHDPSSSPSISADGRFVAFDSDARNLTVPRGGGHVRNVYVHDRSTGV